MHLRSSASLPTLSAGVLATVLATALVTALATVLAGAVTGVLAPSPAAAKDPRLERKFYVDPASSAVLALREGQPVRKLATTPQAVWLTDVTAPRSRAKKVVRAHLAEARKKRRTAVFVLYAIPGRDCGSWSGGGLSPKRYPAWTRAIAAGLKGSRAMVVLEPDAVATLGACAGQGNRAKLLRDAVKWLDRAGAWVYLDGGHSAWLEPAEMARRLKATGVARARGFATNVSNHRTTAAEKVYARQVRRELARLGVPRRRYVIDVSRNGVGPDLTQTWCNNLTARVGGRPRVVDKHGLDAVLWIKRPGESDGGCNGGPEAGRWWPRGARALLGAVG